MSEGASIEAVVAKVERLTDEIRLFELRRADGGGLPPWTPGSHVRVEVGDGETRAYSLMGPVGDAACYRICVRLDPGGRGGSRFMHQLAVGETVRLAPPRNDFPLAPDAALHTLIAGGIGVTPLLAMAARLQDIGARRRIIYCARSPEAAIFLDELRAAHGHDLTEHFDGGDPARNLDVSALLKLPAPGEHVYVCGPAGLIRAVRAATAHWPEGAVHFELFGDNGEVAAVPASAEGFDIVLARRGETLHVPPGKSILRVLIEHGLPVEYYCEQGTCGLCTTSVVSGRIVHRDQVLTDAEKASQKLMQVCVSGPEPGETLVLDL